MRRQTQFNGQNWEFDASPLESPYSFSTHLNSEGTKHWPEFYLDWPNMMLQPKTARMHLYVGADQTAPFDVKLDRMTKWSSAIQIYDTLMHDLKEAKSKDELETFLRNGYLPRLDTVVIDTGTEGLRKLLTILQFPVAQYLPNPFIPSWSDLVEKATSGELVETWVEQKKKL